MQLEINSCFALKYETSAQLREEERGKTSPRIQNGKPKMSKTSFFKGLMINQGNLMSYFEKLWITIRLMVETIFRK